MPRRKRGESTARASATLTSAPASTNGRLVRATRGAKSDGTEHVARRQRRDVEEVAIAEVAASSSTSAASTSTHRNSFDCHLHDWYLHGENEQSLLRICKSDLVTLCKQRGVDEGAGTKADLIEALLHWRKHALPPGMGSHDDLVSKLSARHRDYLSMPNMQELAISGEEEMEEEDAISEEADDACDSAPVLNNVTRPRRTRAAAMDDAESSKKVTFAAPKVDTSSDSAYNSAELSPADTVIPFELLEYGRKVGSGGFKDVYQGTLNGQEVAIAEIKSLDDDEWADLENELAVLGQLRHDSIVRFLGIAKQYEEPVRAKGKKARAAASPTLTKFCIITDFCKHGDLSDYMQATPRPNFQHQLTLMYDIAFGCSYLHGRRPAVIHRDLKSLNILIGNDGRAKISDFGLAKVKKRARMGMQTVVGTPNWQAPEMWTEDPHYTEKVDVYSCGMIFWEILMWSGTYPFSGMSEPQIYEKVGKKGLRPPLTSLKRYGRPIRDLIESMWHEDAELRPSMSDVVTRLSEMMR